jgi:hypothetical protein
VLDSGDNLSIKDGMVDGKILQLPERAKLNSLTK